jgi:hypothetical protein
MPILNVYNELIQYEDMGGDMVGRISALSLHAVFEPIIENYPDRSVFNKYLFYILHVYSKESKAIIPGQNYEDCKRRLAKQLKLSEQEMEDVVNLRCPFVIKTVQRYLRLQMSKTLEHLTMKRELYQQMLQNSLNNLTDKDGVINFDQKFKNSSYADQLYDQIHEWEIRLLEDNKELKAALDELKAVKQRKNNASLRLEDNLKEE